MLQHDRLRQREAPEQPGQAQHEADLPERAAERAADDQIRCAATTEILDRGIDRDRELGQVAADRQHDDADDELGDAEPLCHRNSTAYRRLGAQPESDQAGQ